MKKTILCTIIATLNAAHAYALDVEGVWHPPGKNSIVEISDCGDGTPCGRIVWINPETIAPENRHTVLRDKNNSDPTLRDAPLIDLIILNSFKHKNNRWKSGRIYDPENGKSYRSIIALQPDGDLKVKGCIGPFCQSQIWTKASTADIR